MPNTLTLIKDYNNNIFGGYTSVPWESSDIGTFKKDETAFLFSLNNPRNTSLMFKVNNSEYAVYHHTDLGPVFGEGKDLMIVDKTRASDSQNSIVFKSYKLPPGEEKTNGHKLILGELNIFRTHDIEVFKVK